jgi:hypothetical protein
MNVIRNIRQISIVCAVLFLFPFTLVGAELGFQISPYVQNINKTSATIYWKSTNKETGRVEYGPTAAYGALASGHTKYVIENGSPQPTKGSVNQAHVNDLVPDMLYHYRIQLSSSASGKRTFRTAPQDDNAAFTFLIYGDSRGNPMVHGRVVSAAVATCHAAFVLDTGDVVPSGSAGQSIWTKQFFKPADPLLRESWFVVTRGNHENANPLFLLYFEETDGFQNEGYYSFDWGPAHVVTLNTNGDYEAGSEKYQFHKRDLASTSRPFKVFFGHDPAYSSGSHGSTKKMQDYLQPLFEENGVQLVFAGHDHTYERTIINGITYVVSGGGGAPLCGQEQLRENPKRLVFREIYNFV